jgi:hypothetical protein
MEKKLRDILSRYSQSRSQEPLLTEQQFLDILLPHVKSLAVQVSALGLGTGMLLATALLNFTPPYLVLLIACIPIIVGIIVYFTAP